MDSAWQMLSSAAAKIFLNGSGVVLMVSMESPGGDLEVTRLLLVPLVGLKFNWFWTLKMKG